MVSDRKSPLFRGIVLLLLGVMLLGLTGCEKTKEEKTLCLGVDVAKYQGTVNWEKVASAGAKFAMVRLGYRTARDGVIVEDSNARYNLQEGSKAGIPMGGYFFSTAVTAEEAEEEAAWVADLAAKYPITYPIVFDCEGFDDEDSRQNGMTAQERTDVALAFLKKIEKLGYRGMFYASASELTERWETDRIRKNYKIWVAQYPAQPYPDTQAPDYGGDWDMWQYTRSAKIPGISTEVDLNVAKFAYNGIEPAKDKEAPEEVGPDPEALMAFRDVSETVTAKDQTNLRNVPSQGEDSTVIYTLPNGESVERTGISDAGWSRVVHDGRVLYAVSSYLTTDLNYVPSAAGDGSGLKTQFETVDETVTPKDAVNLRTLPSVEDEDSQVLVQLKHGETVKRTGISGNGWSRLEWEGKTCYAVSSYLEQLGSDGNVVDDDSDDIKTQFEDVEDYVTPKEKVNLRTLPSVEDPDCKIAATITSADTVKRTGINRDVGWSRVEYEGQTLYCITRYLKEAK